MIIMKLAYILIAVLLVAGCTNNLDTPKVISNKEWTTIQTFRGNGTEMSKSGIFHISGDKFRIRWSFEKTDYSSFGFMVFKEYSNITKEIILTENTTGETYVYEGNSDYYIQFNIANSNQWTLTVQDYK
jgi:hypothetical protein